MSTPYDLSRLGPKAFEHMVNALALKVLGAGTTGFGPGRDGGRDGFFEGRALYPSATKLWGWKGIWYIQSKFREPATSGGEQQWLLRQIDEEIKAFRDPARNRIWPDNWIIATNIDPSGVPETGAFDRAREKVVSARPELKDHFHIWGGRKILDFLIDQPAIARCYGHFLTPGDVLSALMDALTDVRADVQRIVWHLIVAEMQNQQYSKLEQAGAGSSTQPGIHTLFVDVPVAPPSVREAAPDANTRLALATLLESSTRSHRPSHDHELAGDQWRRWRLEPERAAIWFLRGGPGQGKSTIGRYFAQLQRAAFVESDSSLNTSIAQKHLADEIRAAAVGWPEMPRIPIVIELKHYAEWLAPADKRLTGPSRRILTYLSERLTAEIGQQVLPGTLRRALQVRSWFVFFDGLDEVPRDVKDLVATEVRYFLEQDVVELDADVLACCTSRPQGYSGEFDRLECAELTLSALDPKRALACARSLLAYQRTPADATRDTAILEQAMERPSIQQLMTTPLQAHIMAIVIREGGKPPERRWLLYRNFYEVIRKREANHDLLDPALTKLLREKTHLLKSVHNRLGFALHARAERAVNAQAQMEKNEFRELVATAVRCMGESEDLVEVVMSATTERLVLVNTPDSGDHVRFDVRQLQEFFAGEFLYEEIDDSFEGDHLGSRLELLDGDAHWREVILFALSAIIESRRQLELPMIAQALERFDTSDVPWSRWARRRLCRGSLAVAALLADGVLEQDQRVRGRFRNALPPAFASTEPAVLTAFLRVQPPNSQKWLLDCCIEALDHANEAELIGAAALLALLPTAEHERFARVVSFFESASPEFVGLLACVVERLQPAELPSWLTDLFYRLLLSDKWLSLSEPQLRLVLQRFVRRPLPAVAESHGWTKVDRDLFAWLLDIEGEPDIEAISAELNGVARTSLGRLLQSIASLESLPDGQALREVAGSLQQIPADLLYALPAFVTNRLPLDWWCELKPQVDALATISDPEAAALVERETFRESAAQALLELHAEHRPITRENVASVIGALLLTPEHLLVAPHLWGELIHMQPAASEAILKAAKSVAHHPVRESARATAFKPVRVMLPEYAALLPHLTPSAVSFPRLDWLSVDAARAIANDPARPNELRLSAHVLIGDTRESIAPLIPLFEERSLRWFAEAVIDIGPTEVVLSELLGLLRSHYRLRDVADGLLEKIRERSTMPVHAAGVKTTWLQENAR
jgi:hypothetical protein